MESLGQLERKIDACLILLLKLTTQDNFVYTLHDKSEMWVNAMREAEKQASRVIPALALALSRSRSEVAPGRATDHASPSDTYPTETEGCKTSDTGACDWAFFVMRGCQQRAREARSAEAGAGAGSIGASAGLRVGPVNRNRGQGGRARAPTSVPGRQATGRRA